MNKYAQKMKELGSQYLWVATGSIVPPISEKNLAEVEQELGVLLPTDYREFVRDYSFTSVDTPRFSYQRDGRIVLSSMSKFGGISQPGRSDVADLVSFRKELIEAQEDWSPDWIAIGEAGSQLLALAISGPDVGKVFLFNQDFGIHFVAASFDEFMNNLEPQPDDQ